MFWFENMPRDDPDACGARSPLSGIAARPAHLIAIADNMLAWLQRYVTI